MIILFHPHRPREYSSSRSLCLTTFCAFIHHSSLDFSGRPLSAYDLLHSELLSITLAIFMVFRDMSFQARHANPSQILEYLPVIAQSTFVYTSSSGAQQSVRQRLRECDVVFTLMFFTNVCFEGLPSATIVSHWFSSGSGPYLSIAGFARAAEAAISLLAAGSTRCFQVVCGPLTWCSVLFWHGTDW